MRLVYIALGWAAGIVLAANYSGGSPMMPFGWLALVILAIIAAAVSWGNTVQRWFMIALVAFTLGGLRMSLMPVTSDVARYNNSGGLTIEGWVIAEPDARDDRVLLRVAADTLTQASQTVLTSGTVLVQAPPLTSVRYGDRVAATGQLITPAESDTFSYADYLARGGVFSIMTNAAVELLPVGRSENALYAALIDFKAQAIARINRHLPEPEAGLLAGILLGSERGIAVEVRDAFNAVGAAHIIAISGFNMAILSSVVVNVLGRFSVSARWSAVIGIAVIGIYTVFVGAGAAVVRAAIMSSLLVIGTAIKRKTYVPASLALVALLISLENPMVLWDAGFQLSLFATLGLALFVDPLSRGFNHLLHRALPAHTARMVGDFLAEPLVVTLAAQITTLPLIVLYFGRLSLVTLAVNLLIIPVQAGILILGIVATALAFIVPPIAQIGYWMVLILLSWTISVVRLFARLPFAEVEFHVDPRLIVLFFAVLIGGALMQATQPTWALRLASLIRRRAVLSATALAGFSMAILMGALAFSRPDGNLHVWMLDMGHSNAVFVETPGGAHVLIDGGRFPSRLLTVLGDRMPFTDRTIEVLAITQPDEFDTAALTAVLDRYDVGVTLTNGHENLAESYAALQARLAGRSVITVRAGYTLDFDDGARLEVLHPAAQPTISDSFDDYTLTLRLSYGGVSFLLPGDLSPEGQTALLENGEWPLATVMQMPKHGAARALSEAFWQAVQPSAVLLQSDPANRSGDPAPDTLALVGDLPLLRTDISGTLHLWTDGRVLWTEQ